MQKKQQKKVKTLLVDGLEDVVIDTKTVSNYDGYLQSHDVLCIRNPKLEDLLHSAKDTKVLYYDEEYYNAAQELKKRGLLGGVDCTLDKQIAYSLSIIKNLEVLVEVGVLRKFGSKARYQVITQIEIIK